MKTQTPASAWVGTVRCAVPVAERSVRRRNEQPEQHALEHLVLTSSPSQSDCMMVEVGFNPRNPHFKTSRVAERRLITPAGLETCAASPKNHVPVRSISISARALYIALLVLPLFLTFNSRTPLLAANPPTQSIPLEFDRSIPLSIQSAPVQWRGYAYHLLQLGSIKFALDRETGHLGAEIKAGTTDFDNVDYSISVAVFGSEGQLLGTARTEQKITRNWLGRVSQSSATVQLDFGSSLDYADAKTFQISISNRKVLTPDAWQNSK